jgi:hypothetical protein
MPATRPSSRSSALTCCCGYGSATATATAPRSSTAASAPPSGETGQVLTFDGSESSDPDEEALVHSWSFDDGTVADGAVVQKAFATPGPHTGTLTVTDPAGLSDDSVATVTIVPASSQQIVPAQASPRQTTPALTSLRLIPSRFRVAAVARGARTAKAGRPPAGTRIEFTLSQAAQVTFTVHRARPKRRWKKAGVFTREAQSGANSLRWGGRIGRQALKPGRYRLSAQAGSGNGPLSEQLRTRFRIVRG